MVLALTALISQMPETQAFAPRLPAFLKPLSPHFLYLGEDAQGLPTENKGGTNFKREFIMPPPSIDDDEALHRALLKARLENRATKTFIEESQDTTKPIDIDNTFHHSLFEARLRMGSRAANDARSTMSASGDGDEDEDEDDDDMDDDVFSSELNLQFEAILKDLEEALKDITDELEATATPVYMECEATRDFVIDMSEGQMSSDDNDDGDSKDDYDNSTIVSVGSVLGEAVDFIMKTNDKKARAANAYQGVCLGEDNDHMSIVSSYGEHDDAYQYMKTCEQSLYHTFSVKGSSIPSDTKQTNCMTLGQGTTISEADDDIHRSILAGRLEIESKEKNQILNATPSTLCTHISPTSTDTISSHSSAVVKCTTSMATHSYAFQRSLLEARLAMIAREKKSVTSSKISDQQTNHSTDNKIDFPGEMTSEANALVSFELEREDSSLPTSAFLPIQDESRISQVRASSRCTRVLRRGNKELKERKLVISSSNERETCEFKGRRTHIIRKGNRNVTLRTQHINAVSQSNGEVEAVLLDGQNQAVMAVVVPTVLEAEPRSKATARLVVTHAVPPSEDTTDTLGNILTNLTKVTVSGGMAVFFTLGAMLDAAGSSDAIQSSKAVSSSMSKVAQSLSSLVNKTSTKSKVPTLSLTSSDVLRGFQSTITSVSAVCVSFLLSFQHSTHSNDAFMARTESRMACRSAMASILALERKTRVVESRQEK